MSFSRLENPPGFWPVSNDNIWMGVLVCPISRKHFLRVVSEWISDFGTISLGFLILSPNSHSKWNHIVTIVLMASLIQALKRRYCHYLSFDSFCLFFSPSTTYFHKDVSMLKEGCMLYNINPSFSVHRYLYSICACPLGIPCDTMEKWRRRFLFLLFNKKISKFYCSKYDLLFDCFIAVISS